MQYTGCAKKRGDSPKSRPFCLTTNCLPCAPRLPRWACERIQRAGGLEPNDRSELERARIQYHRRLLVGRRPVVEPEHVGHRRTIQQVEEIDLRLNRQAADLERLGDVHVELIDAIAVLG